MSPKHSLSIIAVALLPLMGCSESVATTPQKVERPIQVVELISSSQQNTKHFTGTIQSTDSSNVAFRVPGTIEKIHVKMGDNVEKGQLLAELDPHDYQVTLKELQARQKEAKSAFKLAKVELERVQQAIDDDAIAHVNLDRAVSGYERAQSAVQVVGQNIQRAKDSIRYTKLYAPFDGVVARKHIDQYEQVLPGVASFTVHKPDSLEVKIDVPENLIHQFSDEQQAKVSWYGDDTQLQSYLTEIAPLPHPIKQTYSVTFSLIDLEAPILPGKAVTLSTHIGQIDDSFCLPYSALVGSKETQHVFTVSDKQAQQVPVELVSLDANTACITGNLNQGDYVVVSGAPYLEHQQNVSSIQVKAL